MLASSADVSCSVCGDFGLVSWNVPVGHPEFGKLHPCSHCESGRARRVSAYRAKFATAQIPPVYQNLTFETFLSAVGNNMSGKILAYGAAQLMARGETFTLREAAVLGGADYYMPMDNTHRNSLVLTGEVGRGKTGLAISVANGVMAVNGEVIYIRVMDTIEAIQETYKAGYEGSSATEKLHMLKTVPLLIWDEFNLPRYSPDRLEIVEKIVRGRHANNLPFVATTNLTLEDFYQAWGERIGDIVATAHWVEVGGVKLRNTVRKVEMA